MRYLIALLSMILAAAPVSADWEQVTSGLAKQEKAGFGGICGVLVDRANGHLYLNVSDKGMYRSTDHGKSWTPFGAPFKGRTDWPGCLAFDPVGKSDKLLAALVYGAPVLVGTTKGDAWTMLDKKSMHVDWCAVDWSDPAMKFMMAMKHETGGMLLVSHDVPLMSRVAPASMAGPPNGPTPLRVSEMRHGVTE